MDKNPIPIEESVKHFYITCTEKNFIIQLLAHLRENFTLLDIPDYNRLYNETLDFLFRDAVEHHYFDKNTRASSYALFEICADGYNKRNAEKLSEDIMNDFLNERRQVWNGINNCET